MVLLSGVESKLSVLYGAKSLVSWFQCGSIARRRIE